MSEQVALDYFQFDSIALAIARSQQQRFAVRGLVSPLEDVEQEARCGVLRALARYDPLRNPNLIVWVRQNIQWAIKNWYSRRVRMIRIPPKQFGKSRVEAQTCGLMDDYVG